MASTRWEKYRADLLAKADIKALYKELGLRFASGRPSSSGWLSAYGHDAFGEDSAPSAGVNVLSGVYKDHRNGKCLSLIDFGVEIGRFGDWREAQKWLAKETGVRPPSRSKSHPEHEVEWQEWHDVLAMKFCENKPGVTLDGLKRSGAQMCVVKGEPAFAWGVYDSDLTIVGWYYMPRTGKTFEFNKAKSCSKMMQGAEAGLIGLPAVRRLVGDRHPDVAEMAQQLPGCESPFYFAWVEGMTDLLAAYSAFPNSDIFVTNPHGASQNVTETQGAFFETGWHNVVFIVDEDVPGFNGGLKKAEQLETHILQDKNDPKSDYQCRSCVATPWEYDLNALPEKNGRDLRDWITQLDRLSEGTLRSNRSVIVDSAGSPLIYPKTGESINNTPLWLERIMEDDMPRPTIYFGGQALYLVERREEVVEKLEEQDEEIQQVGADRRAQNATAVMKELGLVILKMEEDGSFVLGSTLTNRHTMIRSLQYVSYGDMVLLAGDKFLANVKDKNGVNTQGKYDFEEFKLCLALHGSHIATRNVKVLGEGIWEVTDRDDAEKRRLLAVRAGSFYYQNGNELAHISGPNYSDDYLSDYEDSGHWFDRDKLETSLTKANDRSWRRSVHSSLLSYLRTWIWAEDDMDLICCGLVYATWVQSIWPWRPIVCMTGESESGKTFLLRFLSEVWLNTTVPLGNTTAAGARQILRNRSMPICLDEFDTNRNQQAMFEMLRGTGRGQPMVRGTAAQTAKIYHLRHIPWLSGIYHSTDAQADINRIILLRLLTAPTGKSTIVTPATSGEVVDLGHDILACVLSRALAAKTMGEKLKKMGKRSRFRESYSVPFSMIGAICDLELEQINALMEPIVEGAQDDLIKHMEAKNDQEVALTEILATPVRLPFDAPVSEPTLGMMISDLKFSPYYDRLESLGVRVAPDSLSLNPKMMVANNGLLGQSRKWRNNVGLKQLLRRLNYAPFNVDGGGIHLGGQTRYCYTFRLESLIGWMVRQPD